MAEEEESERVGYEDREQSDDTVNHVNDSHLVALVSDLGECKRLSDGRRAFKKGKECRGCLADLARFLKRDSPAARPALHALTRLQLVGQGIGPLLSSYFSDSNLSLAAVKVLALMTMPPEEDEVTNRGTKQALNQSLQQCKSELLETNALTAIAQLLADLMEQFSRSRTRLGEPGDSLVQLLLSVVRNLLAIEDEPNESTHTEIGTARDQLVERLLDDGLLDMVALSAGHARKPPFRDDAALIAEIYHLAYLGTHPRVLADSLMNTHILPSKQEQPYEQRAKRKPQPPSDELRAVMEATQKPATCARPRMSGAYVRVGEGATGKAIVHTAPWKHSSSSVASFGATKFGRAKPKLNGEQRVASEDSLGVSAKGPLKKMAEHLHTLLGGLCGNELIAQLAEDVHHGRELGMTPPEVRLRKLSTFSLVALFVGFRLEEQRASMQHDSKGIQLGEVDEAVSSRMLTVTRLEWQRASDEKDWEQVDASGRALEAVIRALRSAIESPYADGDVDTATSIALEALHDDTDQGILSTLHRLLKRFDPRKQPRKHAHGLVLGINSTLNLMQTLSRNGNDSRKQQKLTIAADNDEYTKRMMKLIEPQMVVNHVWILRQCNNNAVDVNEASVAFLQRVRGAGYEPMLYQLSILRVMYSILNDSAAKWIKPSKSAYHFASSLASSFLQRALPADDASEEEKGAAAMLFVDVLTWKNRSKAWSIEVDFRGRSTLTTQAEISTGSKRKRRALLSDEGLEELADLYAQHCSDDNPLDAIARNHSSEITAHQARYQLRKLGLTVRVKNSSSKGTNARTAGPVGRSERREAREQALQEARAKGTEIDFPGATDIDEDEAIDEEDEDNIVPGLGQEEKDTDQQVQCIQEEQVRPAPESSEDENNANKENAFPNVANAKRQGISSQGQTLT